MRFDVILTCWIQSYRWSDFSLNHTALLGMMKHLLLPRIENIQSTWIGSIFYIKLTNPECSLISLYSTMTTDTSFHFFMTNLASLVIKDCRISNFSLNNRKTFSQIFECSSHLLDSSFWINLRIRGIQLLRIVFLYLNCLMNLTQFRKYCTD